MKLLEKLPTDKFYKFFAILGLTCIITIYLIQENKKEQVFEIYEKILIKYDSKSDYTTREKYLTRAETAILNRKLTNDSTMFLEVIKSKDTGQIMELLRTHKIEYGTIDLHIDSVIRASARDGAFKEGVDNQIATLMVKLDYRKAELNRWQMMAVPLFILGFLSFLYGVFTWIKAEPILDVKK